MQHLAYGAYCVYCPGVCECMSLAYSVWQGNKLDVQVIRVIGSQGNGNANECTENGIVWNGDPHFLLNMLFFNNLLSRSCSNAQWGIFFFSDHLSFLDIFRCNAHLHAFFYLKLTEFYDQKVKNTLFPFLFTIMNFYFILSVIPF